MTDKLSAILDAISSKVTNFEDAMASKYVMTECSTSWSLDEVPSYIGFEKVNGRWKLCFFPTENEHEPQPVLEMPVEERLEVLQGNPFPHVEAALKECQTNLEAAAQNVLDELGADAEVLDDMG